MVEVLEMVEKAARSRFCILIQGETGTGKERLARAIHLMGGHSADRFVAVNCNSLPDGLQESELFGHKRGAFTGAQTDKPGLFEMADGGTLFLDEVTDLSPAAQGKILRILEDGELRRLGEVKSRRISVRILAATNKPAIEEVRRGRFRKDLFYRLSVFPVTLPPLRERVEDISLLAEFFLAREREEAGKTVSLGTDALEALELYEWPGNVRELENLVCRLHVLADCESTIRSQDLPPEILATSANGTSTLNLRERLELFEREQIESALRVAGGDKERAAASLGITRRWLSEKLRRYTLDRPGTILPEMEGMFYEDRGQSGVLI
jgi:two-component system response regulator AtoC